MLQPKKKSNGLNPKDNEILLKELTKYAEEGASDKELAEFRDSFISLKKKQNSNSTGSQTQKDSQSKVTPKPSTSVGGKQPQVKPSDTSSGESDLINKFGLKPGEKIEGIERKAYESQRNQPKPAVAKKQDTIETKSVSKGLDKKLDAKYEEISQIPVKQNKQFIQDFRNATAITPDYESQVRQEVQDELQGKGVWNTITQGASNLWNKIVPYIPGAPSSEKELEQLKSDVNFLPKAKEEYKNSLLKQGIKEEEITDDILTKGAIELEVNKRIEDKRLSLANDYLDSIPDEVKDSMELNTLREKDLKSPEVKRQYDILLTLDKDLEEDNSELLKLEKIAEEQGGLNEEQLNSYNSILSNVKNKIETRNKLYSSYEKNVSDLTTLEEEYDLFKRSYGFEDKAGKLLNAVADFGLGALQFANMVQRGPAQDLIAMELAGIKNNKDKVVAEKLQKQVEDSKNVNDILDYSADVLISQAPNIAMGYLTGGTSMLAGIGVSSTGNKYSELIKSNIEGETDYSKLQMYLASGLYGGAEMLETNTLKMIGGSKKLISKALKNEPSRNIFRESLSKKTFKAGKEFLKNYKGELTEELTTFGSQKLTDIVVLDMDSKDVFKNAKEEIKSITKDTGVMVVGLNLFPATMSKVINAFAPKDYTYNLDKNNKRIEELSKIINNKDASELARKEAKESVDLLVKANEEGLRKVVENTSKLSDDLVDKVIELEIDSSNLRNKANEINDDKSLTKNEKASLLSGLKDKFVKNELLRDDIVSGRKKSFDILPEEESTKLKIQAAEELKAEAIKSGVEEDKVNIKEEDITKRAIENYEKQPKETTAEKSIEEGPTGKENVQDVTATQGQQDKVVQEEKITKTEEDAIQKQSTGEGVLRPEQSKMGLQEVVEGDQESKVATEEVKSEEEITKIKADLEASKERLNKAFNQYRNVNIAFDPKNQLAKDKELVKALLDYAYNNIRLGKYNAAKLIEDLAKDGIEITRDGARYIFDRASKRVQREVNKAAGVKPKYTEQKRINKAYSIGVADQKVETQKQKDKTKEVRAELKSKLKEVVSQIKKEKDIAKKEALQKQADRLNKKIADLREKSKVEVSELKKQIIDIFSSAKEVIRIDKKLTKENRLKIAKDISNLVESKKVSKRRFKSLINIINKTDINNPVKFDEVVSYAEKLMQDEMYAEKVSEAKSMISSIKKMSKNKLKDVVLVGIAKDFSLIKPLKVADIDSFIEIGLKIKEALKSTSITATKTNISKPLEIDSVRPAIDAILSEQNKNEEANRIKELEYYLGVNEGELSLDELEAAIEDTSRKSKMNSEEVRAKILDIYDTTSAIVSETIKNGEDLFTGDKIELNNKDLKIVEEILKLDIRDVSKNQNKKIIQLIEVLNNFLLNGESNGLELAYRDVLGEVNAKKISRKGIVSKGLKFLYGSAIASRVYMQEIISIEKINDIYFKGFETGSFVDKMSGLSDILFNVSKTKKEIYNKLDAYKSRFKDSKPNGEGFFSPYNIVERGMYAFITRSVDGNLKDVEGEFKRRKGVIQDSIDSMMNSNDELLIEKAELYSKVFDNIVGDSNRAEDVKIDKVNKDAVGLMQSYWESYYSDASDLSMKMYNTILGKDINYTHDSYSEITKKDKDVSKEINENFSFIVNQHITKKKSSTLLEIRRSDLQENLYVNLSFEEANFKAMKETAIDISTTKYTRQMASFLNSESLSKLIPVKEDRELYKRRVVSYINRVKGRDFVPKDELKGIDDALNALNAFGTSLLLGGVTQPLKQTVPVAVNTLFNAGDLSLSIVFDKDVREFMKNNGYSVSYRGIESLSNIEESRSNFESINRSKSKIVSEWIQDKSKTYLKLFLGNADTFIAMASWMTYYKKKLIETKGKEYFDSIDWKTHEVDREAGDYAQKQLDRQQAPSDVELKGELFSGKETHKKIANKLLFPLSSFSLNQKSRMYNDISVLFAKENFSDNDKKIAALSLSGLLAEQAVFRSIQAVIGYYLLEASAALVGLGDDDEELKEEKEKLKKNIIKGTSTSLVADFASPLPITDAYTSSLVNDLLDIMYSATEVKDEDKFFLYDVNSKRKESFIDVIGVGGASIDKALSVRESSIMAIDGTYTTNFNGKKSKKMLSEKSKDIMITASTIEAMSFLTLLPSEGFNIANSMKKFAKKQSISVDNKEKFIEEQIGYGYTKEEANKMYEDYIEYLKQELKYKYED